MPWPAFGPIEGTATVFGTFSGTPLASGGMFQSTQCVHSRSGTSSRAAWLLSTSSARLTVPSGTPVQSMGGEMSSRSQLYCLGMRRVSLNLVLLTSMVVSNCWASL